MNFIIDYKMAVVLIMFAACLWLLVEREAYKNGVNAAYREWWMDYKEKCVVFDKGMVYAPGVMEDVDGKTDGDAGQFEED